MIEEGEERDLFEDYDNSDESIDETTALISTDNVKNYSVSYKKRDAATRKSGTFTIDDAFAHAGVNIPIVFCCLFMWFNAMIIMLNVSILPTLIKCDLGLDVNQLTLVSSLNFVGLLVGTFVFGSILDRYGRKRSIIISVVLAAIVSGGFAAWPSYAVACVGEFLLGFLNCGMLFCWSQCVELLPPARRSWSTFLNVGTMMASGYYSLVAWLFLDTTHSWRWVLVVGHVVPFLLSVPLYMFFVPLSPRYLVMIGQYDQAEKIIHNMWKAGKVEPLDGHLIRIKEIKIRGSPLAPFSKKYLFTTLMGMLLWCISGIIYFDGMFLVTVIRDACDLRQITTQSNTTLTFNVNDTVLSTKRPVTACVGIDAKDLLNLFITAIGEVPAIGICIYLMDKIGRPKTLGVMFIAKFVSFFPLGFCEAAGYSWLPLSVIRAASTGTDSVLNVFIPELYPTFIRNTAVSVVRIPRQLGLVATPYISALMLEINFRYALSFLAALIFVAIICSFMWKHDTTSVGMTDGDDKSVTVTLDNNKSLTVELRKQRHDTYRRQYSFSYTNSVYM